MANHNLPLTTSTYQDFVTELDARFDDLCYGLDPAITTMTNIPTNAVGWSSASSNWKKWTGTNWTDLATTYDISIAGSAATLTTPRTINAINFNGSGNIVVEPYVERDDSSAAIRYLTFVDTSTAGHQRLNLDVGLTYNPSTQVLDTSISGNALTATNSTTVTNGVYTVGDQSIGGTKNFSGSNNQDIVAVPALDIVCSSGNFFTKTITANSVFTFSSPPTTKAYSFVLELTHNSGTVTWPSSVVWPENTTPSLTTGKTHLFVFVTDNTGVRWRGASLANYTT